MRLVCGDFEWLERHMLYATDRGTRRTASTRYFSPSRCKRFMVRTPHSPSGTDRGINDE